MKLGIVLGMKELNKALQVANLIRTNGLLACYY